ncbi:MAG TPA: hypothetical protein VHG31_03655, partial [Stellaceae bacterium]|nr:hypothetical protein [Stellaceae bacterium]
APPTRQTINSRRRIWSLASLGTPGFSRHSPDTGDISAKIALLTGFGNGKSPSPRAKGDQGLRLSRHTVG